jgi:hypothetical protein
VAGLPKFGLTEGSIREVFDDFLCELGNK